MFALTALILTSPAYAASMEDFPVEMPETTVFNGVPGQAEEGTDVESETESATRLERIESGRALPKMQFTHGFRIGYGYVRLDGNDDDPLKSSHLFTVGYEVQQRILGGGWLNVLLVENVMISGINQSKFIPTANLLLGFEFREQLQIGAGMNLSPFSDPEDMVHMVMGVGYTPQVGSFNVPLHLSFIPDVDGNWRAQMTTGVNW
jgi:hypothetical protein